MKWWLLLEDYSNIKDNLNPQLPNLTNWLTSDTDKWKRIACVNVKKIISKDTMYTVHLVKQIKLAPMDSDQLSIAYQDILLKPKDRKSNLHIPIVVWNWGSWQERCGKLLK